MATTTRKIIEDRGGSAAVAHALSTPGCPVRRSTVHSWIVSNSIPPWRKEAVLDVPVVAAPKRKRAA